MDVKGKEKKEKGQFFFGREKTDVGIISETNGNLSIALNIFAAALGFLFGGCHLIFGTYPLGLGFITALRSSVWSALLGVVLGSLTLGKSGIIYAMICVLAVFLRIIVSGGSKKIQNSSENGIFSENIPLRVCSAAISAFVAAIYEILISGFKVNTLLFGVFMILLASLTSFIFSGVFVYGISVRNLCIGGIKIGTSEKEKYSLKLVFLKISLLAYLFFISISLDKYSVFGIDLSFVFSAGITLFAAKRFGSLYGTVTGFISSVGISGLYSVAFALLGAASGALFVFGSWYAVAGGGTLLSVWGAYSNGVSGFLTVFPEFIISLCITMPLFRYLERETSESEIHSEKKQATDMVGTMALSYRSKKALSLETIESVISALTPQIKRFCENDIMTETYTVFSKLLTDAKMDVIGDREMDEELTDDFEEIFSECGFDEGVIRVFGRRHKYVICAGSDKDGIKITSPILKQKIEQASGLKFSTPEYYRRMDMVLMECENIRKYILKSGVSQKSGVIEEANGDTACKFESKELFAYGVISDGMGSGEEAKRTSDFVVNFLKASADLGTLSTPIVHMLNSIVRRNPEECGASLDVFSFDLLSGEAFFLKCGAAPSFIKRGTSLFRIKSETMPLGFIGQVDAEKTAVKVNTGDYIIMISDGVCQIGEDAPWLIDALNKPIGDDLNNYADFIVREAQKNGKTEDDMTVLILFVDDAM